MSDVETHYELLGVSEKASPEELKRAYRQFMREHHPDIHPGEENEELCRRASEAYSIVGNEESRAAYDKSLHEPEPEPEPQFEDWAPSWGEEESWSEAEVFADVVEEPFAPPPPKPDFENEPTFGSEDKIGKLPPVEISDAIKDGSIRFKGATLPSVVAVILMMVAPFVAFFTHPLEASGFQMLALPIVAAATIAAIVYSVKWKLTHRFPWWGLFAVAAAAYVGFSFLVKSISSSYANIVFLAAFPAAIVFFALPTVTSYFHDRRLLKPKNVKKHNSFGQVSGTVAEELLEEALNPLWGIPGLRCFRFEREGFSHMLIFNCKVVLLKPVYLEHPGVLKFSGSTLMNRFAADLYQPLLTAEYIANVAEFAALAPKSLKVYPMVVALPGRNLQSFEKDERTTVVAGDDVAALVARTLLTNEEENVVDYAATVSALKASYGMETK